MMAQLLRLLSVYQKKCDEDILITSDFRLLVSEDENDILKYNGILSENTIEEFIWVGV